MKEDGGDDLGADLHEEEVTKSPEKRVPGGGVLLGDEG